MDEPIQPFKNDSEKWEQITVKMLIEMLKSLPAEYGEFKVKYDSACGGISKRDFTIYPKDKEISING